MMAAHIARTKSLVRRGERSIEAAEAKRYLRRYGYLGEDDCADDLVCEHASRALRHLQAFYGLDTTGSVTLETLKLIRRPRCPVPDFDPEELGGPGVVDTDPFVFTPNIWDQGRLRWFLQTGTGDTTGEAAAMSRAFSTWAEHIPLSFQRTFDSNQADFVARWATGDHGDGAQNAFDGAGTILAHAFFPTDGRIHFDDAEFWADTSLLWFTDVETVALHEIGHGLGLRHSGLENAVMFAFINGTRRELHEVDIRGIKSRYPVRVSAAGRQVVTVPLHALRSGGGCSTVQVDLGATRRVLAWGQVTMVDSLADADRDNAWAVEVFDVDGDRPGGFLFGGDHLGSEEAPSNVYSPAFIGDARRITYRMSSFHTADLDAFGVGNVLLLDDEGVD